MATATPFPPGTIETHGGLRYLNADARQAFSVGFEAVAFKLPPQPSITMMLEASVGLGGASALKQMVASGYVVIVSSWSNQVIATKNPLVVEDSTGPTSDGSWAVFDGPSSLLSVAQVGVKVPGPSWVFPVVAVAGVVSIIWLLRR